MKTKTMNEDLEQTKEPTALESAIAVYDAAVVELHDHRGGMQALRSRVNELSAAIRDINQKASKQPSLATLTLDQIKALSASKAAEFAELSGLNAALDCAEVELRNMESDERGIRILIQDTKTGVWAALYEQLKEGIDLDLVAKLITAGFMAGMSRRALCDDFFGEDDNLDAGLAETLAQQFGLPL